MGFHSGDALAQFCPLHWNPHESALRNLFFIYINISSMGLKIQEICFIMIDKNLDCIRYNCYGFRKGMEGYDKL